MGKFRYQAENEQGEHVQGDLQADTLADAQTKLRQAGLRPVEVQPVPEGTDAAFEGGRLRGHEAEAVVAHLADLGAAQVPLAAGLRAAAWESPQPRVAGALNAIASSLEQGNELEKALDQLAEFLPAHVRGLVAAAARTGHLGPALDELVEHQQLTRDTKRGVWASVAYPLIVLGITILILGILPVFVVPTFRKMFEEFELALPAVTQLLIQTSDLMVWLTTGPGFWVASTVVGVVVIGVMALPVMVGRARSRRILITVPLVGPLWNWMGASSFCRLLAVLLDSGVPLPEALRLTADGLRDANFSELCLELSGEVGKGRKFSELLESTPRVPASMVPLIRWGETTGELAEALRVSCEMFLQRVRTRSVLLRSVSPPLVFILVGLAIGFMVIALFMPLISLIQGLS
jgi:type II secretory pathway component PulF